MHWVAPFYTIMTAIHKIFIIHNLVNKFLIAKISSVERTSL